jgi:hypothetical protein
LHKRQRALARIQAYTRLAYTTHGGLLLQFRHAARVHEGHWLTLYRRRFPSDAPPIEMRVMTWDRPQAAQLSDDIPNYKTNNGKFMWKLLTAWIAMLFGR